MKPPPLTDARRAELLKMAEALWIDLEGNQLGGFSGINRPFWIMETLKRVDRDGFAAGFAKALEMLTSEKEARERAAAGIVLALNASGSKGDDLILDAAGSALRAAASAIADIAEKEGG